MLLHPGKQDEFERFFLNKALPKIKAQPGLVSVIIGKPIETSPTESIRPSVSSVRPAGYSLRTGCTDLMGPPQGIMSPEVDCSVDEPATPSATSARTEPSTAGQLERCKRTLLMEWSSTPPVTPSPQSRWPWVLDYLMIS